MELSEVAGAALVSTILSALVVHFTPVTISEIVAADTSDWSPEAAALWGILDVVLIAVVILIVILVGLSHIDKK